MNDEQRAHDLALLFLQFELASKCADTDEILDQKTIFDMYKHSYDNFLDFIVNP